MEKPEYRFKMFAFKLKSRPKKGRTRPLPKLYHRTTCNNDYLISYASGNSYGPLDFPIIGEEARQLQINGSLWKYNFISGCWICVKCQNFPKELNFNSVLLSGNTLFIHGSPTVQYYHYTNYLTYIGDLSNDHNGSGVRFKEIRSTGEILTIGYSQQVIIEDQYVYSVYGMAEHENEMDVYRLDLRTKNWELLCQAKGHYVNNTHKLKHNMALYNNKIYLFGGAYYPCSNHTVRFISLFQKIHIFDVLTKKWRYLDTLPDNQNSSNFFPLNRIHYGFAQCVVQKNFVYICGGGDGIVKSFNDIWRFNLATLQWYEIKSFVLPDPTHLHSMVITPAGQLYYHDGLINRRHVYPNDKVFCAWIRLPSLKSICWDAMLYYFKKQMLKSSDAELKNLGLPLEYYKNIIIAKNSFNLK